MCCRRASPLLSCVLCCQSYFGLPEAWGQYISTTVYWSVDCQPGGSLVCGICSHCFAQTAHSSTGWEALTPSQFLKGTLSEQQGQLDIQRYAGSYILLAF